MSTISASTTSTTAFKVTSDTTGTLVFQTGATPTTALTLGSDQSATFAGAQTFTGGATFSSGITVQGLTVGKGAGAVSTKPTPVPPSPRSSVGCCPVQARRRRHATRR